VPEINNSASEKTEEVRVNLKISTAPEETKEAPKETEEAEKPRTPVGQHKPPKNMGDLTEIPTAFACPDKAGGPLSKEEIAEFEWNLSQEFFQRGLAREIRKQEILAPTAKKLEEDFNAVQFCQARQSIHQPVCDPQRLRSHTNNP